MTSKSDIYIKLKEIVGEGDTNYSILQERIDVDTQLNFFEVSSHLKEKMTYSKDLLKEGEKLFKKKVSIKDKKELLIKLSLLGEIEAYYIIKDFRESASGELLDWAVLASYQSRIRLTGKYMDEQQVFISTGLGGKGNMLRYFVVFKHNNHVRFSELESKVVKSEIEFVLNRNRSICEKINYESQYIKIYALIPFVTSAKELFQKIIQNCNQLGKFISDNFVITNIKEISDKDLEQYFKTKR